MSQQSRDRRRRTLLAEFDRKRRRWRRVLAERFGAEEADAVLPEVRANFAATVDEIPYANRPEPVMADQIVAAYQYLALYKALKARGKSLEEIGALADELIESPVPRWVPRWLLPLTSRLFLVPRMRRYARESQESADPDEFVYEFVEGDGDELDFGLNIRSCAICKMATKHDAIEMVPYLCATDDKVFAEIGLGLRRTGTIALGATHCDFRHKFGGEPLTLREQYSLSARQRLDA